MHKKIKTLYEGEKKIQISLRYRSKCLIPTVSVQASQRLMRKFRVADNIDFSLSIFFRKYLSVAVK